MPAKHNALLVGHIDCPECGNRASVYQNVKSALYVRCPDCGCDQRNGRAVQTRVWYSMEPEPGVDACRPANVPEEKPDWLAGAGRQKPEAAAKSPEKKKAGAGVPVGLLALVGVGVFGFMKALMG